MESTVPACCAQMQAQRDHRCSHHPDACDCPDALIQYTSRFDEYGIIVHDGGASVVEIAFCPWCGAQLPTSKRDRWFAELAALGFDDPFQQAIPVPYTDDAWYRASSSAACTTS